MKLTLKNVCLSAIIAALYVSLTIGFAPISYNNFQFRISEAMTVIPFLAPTTSVGLFVGCFIANIFSPNASVWDIVFGSLTTLLAGLATSKMPNKWLAPLPPILFNAFSVGLILAFTLNNSISFFPLYAGQVGFGQLVVCYGLGIPLLMVLEKTKVIDRLK